MGNDANFGGHNVLEYGSIGRRRTNDADGASSFEGGHGQFDRVQQHLPLQSGCSSCTKHRDQSGLGLPSQWRFGHDPHPPARHPRSSTPGRGYQTTSAVSVCRTPTAPAIPVVIQLPSDWRSGLSTKAIRSKRPITAWTCLITESSSCIPRSSPTSSWTRLGSAEMSTYAVTMPLSSVAHDSSREPVRSPSFEFHQRHTSGASHLLELVPDTGYGERERKHLLAYLHVGVRGERVPEHAVQIRGHLGY